MVKSHIHLHQLELQIYLGAFEEERKTSQRIWVDIDIHFQNPPTACLTDKITDTFCYDSLTQIIAKQITPRVFHLIEHVAHEIYHLIKKSSAEPIEVLVKVTKKPLLSANLVVSHASFTYGDK